MLHIISTTGNNKGQTGDNESQLYRPVWLLFLPVWFLLPPVWHLYLTRLAFVLQPVWQPYLPIGQTIYNTHSSSSLGEWTAHIKITHVVRYPSLEACLSMYARSVAAYLANLYLHILFDLGLANKGRRYQALWQLVPRQDGPPSSKQQNPERTVAQVLVKGLLTLLHYHPL